MIVKNNKPRNSRRVAPKSRQDILFENMAERITKKVTKTLLEDENLEEGWFGFGSAKKPEKELTAEFIRTASQDEVAELLAEYLNYWAASASDSVDKALTTSFKTVLDLCKSGADKTGDASKKVLMGIVTAVRKGVNGTLEATVDGVKGLGRLIMLGVAMCFKLAANGIELGKQAAASIYKTVKEFLEKSYNTLKDKMKAGADAVKDGLTLTLKVSLAALLLCANKVEGAAQSFGGWIKQVAKDAADKVVAGVVLCRTWFAAKASEVAAWVKETIGDVRQAIVTAWNGLEKSVVSLWKNVSGKILDWCNDVRVTVAKIGEKISDAITSAGDHIIAAKDKAVVSAIGKGVRMLSKNYTEDDIVAIVRAAYNEDLKVDMAGNTLINESYYTKTNLRRI